MNIPQTLDFLAAVCEQAEHAHYQGNGAPLRELGRHPALAHYYANVVKLAALTPQQWADRFPPLVADADALRQRGEQTARQALELELQAGQIAALEAQIDRLAAALRETSVERRIPQDQKGADVAPAETAAEEG
jgi:hypothetical protein